MNGRILVVDDLEPNRRLLQVRLEADYYQVETAEDGPEALDLAFANPPDLVLLDVMMPKMDGFEVCRRLKADPRCAHVPVIILTALDQREDRIRGLEAGADDFLSKPFDDAVLRARARNLLWLKSVTDELIARDETGQALATMDESERQRLEVAARILVVDDPCRASERLARRLEDEHHRPRLETDPQAALRAARGPWDLAIIDFAAETFDGMQLAKRIKAEETTRDLPVLAIIDTDDRNAVIAALEAGVNDVIDRPVDGQELSARVRTAVKRKRFADFLRARLDETLEASAKDQLTGALTPRATVSHVRLMMQEATETDGQLSVALIDIDGLRRINAAQGHRVGDLVLRDVAERVREAGAGGLDLGRCSGDEFLALMPGVSAEAARDICKAAREAVAKEPYAYTGREPITVAVSVGLTHMAPGDTLGGLLDRAERALAAAKDRGGNRVVTARRAEDSDDRSASDAKGKSAA